MLDTRSAQEYSTIPVDQARSAMFFDGDVITTDYGKQLKRWTIYGEFVWEGPDGHDWEFMMIRCGDDICMGVGIYKPHMGTLYRYSGVGGHLIEKHSYTDLVGLQSQSETFGSSADHKSILVPSTMVSATLGPRYPAARRRFWRGPPFCFFLRAPLVRLALRLLDLRMSLIFQGVGRREIDRRMPIAPMLTSSDEPP